MCARVVRYGVIAGIGNIDSDEILLQVGVYPETKVSRLDRKEMRELFDAMQVRTYLIDTSSGAGYHSHQKSRELLIKV